jgi:hypothetical protein
MPSCIACLYALQMRLTGAALEVCISTPSIATAWRGLTETGLCNDIRRTSCLRSAVAWVRWGSMLAGLHTRNPTRWTEALARLAEALCAPNNFVAFLWADAHKCRSLKDSGGILAANSSGRCKLIACCVQNAVPCTSKAAYRHQQMVWRYQHL